MIVTPNNFYITEAGYVVKIDEDMRATVETSPGTYRHVSTHRSSIDDNLGWKYHSNGHVATHLSDGWSEKLSIVRRYHISDSNLKLPDGHQWVGGYPQFVKYDSVPDGYYVKDTFHREEVLNYKLCFERKPESKPMTPLRLTDGKTYITKAGYLVSISKHAGRNYAAIEHSPGQNDSGKSIKEIVSQHNRQTGWLYNDNGSITGLSEKWNNDLTIVEEYNGKIPVLEKDEQWYEGFPRFLLSEHFNMSGDIPLVRSVRHRNGQNEYICIIKAPAEDSLVPNKNDDFLGTYGFKPSLQDCYKGLGIPMTLSNPFIKERSKMENEPTTTKTNMAKSITMKGLSLFGRTVNYWLCEPAKEVAGRIMRSVRYAVLASVITGGVYAYNSPENATKFFKSLLPKVTIEAPEIIS